MCSRCTFRAIWSHIFAEAFYAKTDKGQIHRSFDYSQIQTPLYVQKQFAVVIFESFAWCRVVQQFPILSIVCLFSPLSTVTTLFI